jgi:hypothetical protein
MPLAYLIAYFNDRIRESDFHILPDEPLVQWAGQTVGRFATLQLTSVFQPVISVRQGGRVVGHEALLRAYTGDGRPLAPRVLLMLRGARDRSWRTGAPPATRPPRRRGRPMESYAPRLSPHRSRKFCC